MKKMEQLQNLISLYKRETGNNAVDMDDVARWAIGRGVKPPQPKTELELMSKQLADAARLQHNKDPNTGYSYRVNHALTHSDPNGKQRTLWVDIHSAKRSQMHASLTNRRQQMIGDGVQLTIDQTVWNNLNPNEEAIQMVLDFTEDVAERLQMYGSDESEAA